MNILPIVAIAGGITLYAASAGGVATLDYQPNDGSNPLNYPNTEAEQIDAFLSVIRYAESADDYGAIVGGGRNMDLSHHIAFTDATMARKSAYGNGAGYRGSHAFGAYQFQPQTWKECSDALGLNGDMSQGNQDKAAVFLIKRRGAYQAILDGDIQVACDLLKNEWQFLTLPRWDWLTVANTFVDNGGSTA
jgi:muramidase (phage lysozyme)